MAGKHVKVPLATGGQGEGVEVFPLESTERWSEFTLDDGTKLRLKMMVVKFIRVDGEFDQEGNPVYAVNGQPQITYVEVPPEFMRKAN